MSGVKLTKQPNMDWLRLSPRQARVFLCAWSYDSIVCSGRDLSSAHRLVRNGVLTFVGPVGGGIKGEFALSEIGKDYPPVGLKALHVRRTGRFDMSAALSTKTTGGE